MDPMRVVQTRHDFDSVARTATGAQAPQIEGPRVGGKGAARLAEGHLAACAS
jgi:hypothetical protein